MINPLIFKDEKKIYFREFTEHDIPLLHSWRKDRFIQKYVHYASLEDWFHYMNENPNYYSWIAYDRELPHVAIGIANHGLNDRLFEYVFEK